MSTQSNVTKRKTQLESREQEDNTRSGIMMSKRKCRSQKRAKLRIAPLSLHSGSSLHPLSVFSLSIYLPFGVRGISVIRFVEDSKVCMRSRPEVHYILRLRHPAPSPVYHRSHIKGWGNGAFCRKSSQKRETPLPRRGGRAAVT